MNRITLLVNIICLGALSSNVSWGRDLQGRLGLGFNNQFANSDLTNATPGVSFRYGLTRDFGGQFVFGISTSKPTNSVIAAKFFSNMFLETNLNFYAFGGMGFVQALEKRGVEIMGGFGAEFFIPGIESLGILTELGGSFHNLTGSYAFKTLGSSFVSAGMHFYF